MSNKPELRVGTGYNDNSDMENFIKSLLEREIIIEKGGIMKPGAFLKVGNETLNIAKITVEELQMKLKDKGIEY